MKVIYNPGLNIAIELGNTRKEIIAQKDINKKSRAMLIRLSDQADRLTKELLDALVK